MKTADLIPFILLELNEGDKYGFELTKEIETKSNGKIVIKQPTLYTLLKKLEKSKFITSYWQDSEIGGKRHYYKITENGKLQLSTLPNFDVLLASALSEDSSNEEQSAMPNPTKQPVEDSKIDSFSIFDAIDDEPKESILPSNEVFSNESVDTSTTFETNLNNSEIVNQNDSVSDFAENNNVSKFTETNPSTPPKQMETTEEKSKIDELHTYSNYNDEPIKFVDYVDFTSDPIYKKAKSTAKNTILKALSTSGYLLIILAFCGIIVGFTGGSALYYTSLIISICIAIFYPVLLMVKYDEIKEKCKQSFYVYNTKKTLIIHSLVFVVLLITIIVMNFVSGINVAQLFSIKNFANFYAPILLLTSLYMETLFSYIFLIKKNK